MTNKVLYLTLLSVIQFSSCKKSKEARQLEKEIANTRWEFYYAEDANGNDITAQVLADSVICECFEFYKTDKDATTFNTYISRCHGTFFEDYKGSWSVYDWVKKQKERERQGLPPVAYSNEWADFGFTMPNTGIESQKARLYLWQRNLYFEEELLIDPIYVTENNGILSDSLLGYRYYRKIN